MALETVRASVVAEKPCRCPKCRGLVKPDIVFFGENLPELFFRRATADFPEADLLIVMGTSLVVNPFASLIGEPFLALYIADNYGPKHSNITLTCHALFTRKPPLNRAKYLSSSLPWNQLTCFALLFEQFML